MQILGKVMVIVGSTASGKSGLAIRLAKKFNGEVVSADSRQVYTGLDIGTGKVLRSRPNPKSKTLNPKQKLNNTKNLYISDGVVHHLIDVASPKRQFTVAQYQKLAQNAITDILRRGKVPIICGGTGLYVDTLVYRCVLPAVKQNATLRKRLSKKSLVALYRMLRSLDPRRAKTIDPHNPRRLIRALEIVLTTGKPVPTQKVSVKSEKGGALWIGLNPPKQKLYRNIRRRFFARIRQGMIAEVRGLKKQGVSSRRLESLGLEYRYVNRFLEGKLKKADMIRHLEHAIRKYAKRQMTWFRRDKEIHWIHRIRDAEKLAKRFLN